VMDKCIYTNFRKKIHYYLIATMFLLTLLFTHSEVSAAEPKAVNKEDFGGWREVHVTTGNDITGPTMSASGQLLATIDVFFYFNSDVDAYSVSYIDVYRASSEKGKYKCVGTIKNDDYGDFSFSDTSIDPLKNYYYYGIAYWEATDSTPKYCSTKSETVCGIYGMASPHFYTQGSEKKNIVLCFTNSGDSVSHNSFSIAQSHEPMDNYCNCSWTGIEIYRSTSKNGGYKKIATITSDKATYTDKKVSKGVVYYYKTRSYYKNPKTGKVTHSPFTSPHVAKSGGYQNVDLNLEVKRLSSNSFKMTWDNSKAYSGYSVEYQSNESGGAWKKGNIKISGDKCYCTIKGLKKGDSYYVRLNAMPLWGAEVVENGFSYTNYYICSYDTIYETNLNKPQNLSYKVVSTSLKASKGNQTYTGKFKLTWDKVDGAAGYRIYKTQYTATGEKKVLLATCKGNSKTSVVITLKDYHGFIYVQAYKGSQKAETGIYMSPELKSPSVSKIKIKKNGKKGTTISWSNMSKYGATSYKVYRYNNRLDRSYLVGETDKNFINDTKLKVKGTYTYLIVPCNQKFRIGSGGVYKKYVYK